MENILGQKKVDTFIENVIDNLYIEDISGRLLIYASFPNFKVEEYISGIPIAIKGKLNQNGVFLFDDYIFYDNFIDEEIININEIQSENNEQLIDEKEHNYNSKNISSIKKSIEQIENDDNKDLFLFISNLNLGKISEYNNRLKPCIRTLLIDFIQNNNNINNTLYQYSNKINRIILVGNSLNTFESEIEKKLIFDKTSPNLENINQKILDNYLLFNNFLNIISNYIYIDVMPSLHSNDDLKYPQSPLNKLLFTENIPNINFSSLNLVPNPYFFDIFIPSLDKRKYFIGTSGENINIIKQYSSFEKDIDVMKKNIEWRHLCPIDPSYSTLYSLDNQTDPLILNKIPDVYFTSGNKELNYEKIKIKNKDIIFISLPDFDKTSKCVLYNYKDDSIKQIDFSFDF